MPKKSNLAEAMDLEELDSLDFEETNPGLTITIGPNMAPSVPDKPSTGLNLGRKIVDDVEHALGLDETDLSVEQKLLLIAYGTYGTLTQACKAVGVSPLTHKKWLRENETYAEVFQVAFDIVTDKLEETSLQASLDPLNVKERLFHLQSRRPERYGQRTSLKVGGEIKHTHSMADLAKQAYLSGEMEDDD